MAYRPLYGTRYRDFLHTDAAAAAYFAGRGRDPICPHCDLPVTPDQAWDEVHVGAPKCFGGKSTTVGHRRCNQLDNNTKVTPAAAKAEAVRKRHLGVTGPGLGPHPMQCGRRSKLKKTFRNGVQPRQTLAEQHQAFLARRYGFGMETGHED